MYTLLLDGMQHESPLKKRKTTHMFLAFQASDPIRVSLFLTSQMFFFKDVGTNIQGPWLVEGYIG